MWLRRGCAGVTLRPNVLHHLCLSPVNRENDATGSTVAVAGNGFIAVEDNTVHINDDGGEYDPIL